MTEVTTPDNTVRSGSTDKVDFSKAELNRMLASIDQWWGKHGDEEKEELEVYVRRLYESIPSDLREGLNSDLVRVNIGTLYSLMSRTLGPVFGHFELGREVERFQKELLLNGAKKERDNLVLKRGVFLETFDEFFDPEEMSGDLAEQLESVKEYLVA